MRLKILFFIILNFIVSNAKDYIADIWGGTVNIEFSIKNDKLYFGKEWVSEIDSLTFEKINDYYIKDKNGIYYVNAYGMIIGEADDNIENENWYKSSLESDNQWYGVELKKQKIENIIYDYDNINYKAYSIYLFIDNKIYKRGKFISNNLIIDHKNISFLYKRCQIFGREEKCDIAIKDKKNLYILIDKLYGDNNENTEIYKINNIKDSDFEKAISPENNYINMIDNLIKKGKKL